MSDTKGDFVRNLVVLRNRYIKALDVKIDRMKLAFESIEQVEEPGVKIRDLLTLAHDMAGSCAFFGLEEMGEVAQVLEFYLQSLEAQLPSLEHKQLQKVGGMIQALESAKENSLKNTAWAPESLIPNSLKTEAD